MRIVMEFQYFPETKHENAHIVVLDSEGDLWMCYSPMNEGARWCKIALPDAFHEEDDDDGE